MPIALEPNLTFDVWLDSDKDKPIASRPVFVAKTQSLRKQREIHRVIDMIFEEGVKVDDVFDSAVACILDSCAGWRNMGNHAFTASGIEDVLSFSEIREVLRKVAANQKMSGDEKKD
jgi:hypothetical protein